jgi:DNA-binding response OmpR family regulator
LTTPLVLISDDDTILANSMVRAARHAGMRAFSDTGSRAPDLAVRYQPDVIVLDVMQPIDGRELLAEMKRDARTKDIRVVMVSGVTNDSVRDACLSLGAEDFVPKPFPAGFFQRLATKARQDPRARSSPVDEAAPTAAPSRGRVVVVGPLPVDLLPGLDVERVANAEAALEVCRRLRVNVVVTEQPDAGPGGVELVLRARELSASTRGVVLADASQYLTASRLDPLGGCQLLLKPCKPEHLAEAINRAARVSHGRLSASTQ